MKNLFFAALATLTLASCVSDEFVGENPATQTKGDGSINFGFSLKNMTRADIYGESAATLLGNNFYVTGTKGTEAATSPSPTLVFDNYLVHYGVNTAGTTESNTANWEYVGVTPGTSPYEKYDKLSALSSQTIKYWDYNAAQYDFLAFSVGNGFDAKKDKTAPEDDEIGVTAMKYGTDLASSGTAYTFYLPSEDALAQTYISDITEVLPANYGKEVSLKFKSLGSKVRVALYETVPGYSVKNVQFYTVDGTTDFSGAKGTDAALIFASEGALTLKGQIDVKFPHVGDNNASEADYDVAIATVTPGSNPADKTTKKTFGALKLVAKQADETGDDNVFIGRTLPTASFAGTEAKQFYTNVFPVSSNAPITLRVDYTLVPIDGAAETITVKGAKAVVPATYTKWLPNYAYTYIFKISDNTNGWTGTGSQPSGLFPITFDAVVTEATDATAEQKTITTVATPSITTYQQGHNIAKDEYSKATAKNIYVQVMDNSTATATLVGDLNGTTKDATKRSLLYVLTGTTPATEALVMDALENQFTVDGGTGAITGRNGVVLTPATINAGVTSIVNGPDDNPIAVTAGQAAEIAYTLDAGTYAYVYDYTASDHNKVNTTIYQPITTTSSTVIATTQKYVTTTDLDAINTEVVGNVTVANENVDADYIYFSKTKNGTSSWTYSFVSVDGKKKLPAGLVKCAVSSLTDGDGSTTVGAAGAAFVFTKYIHNDGKYAVKVIKIVA